MWFAATGVVRIGISYDKLCQSVKPGNMILVADGSLTIEVLQILSGTELRGRWVAVGWSTCSCPGAHNTSPACIKCFGNTINAASGPTATCCCS